MRQDLSRLQHPMSDIQTSTPAPRTISGRWMVIGMFLLGITATGLLYAYWTLHLMPFMPLQEAIVGEFPGSAPRVDGGKKRMSENTPTILRIVMKSETDPQSLNTEAVREIDAVRKRIAELVLEKVPLQDLSIIELHIYKLLQEKEIRERSWRLELSTGADWYEVDQRGDPVLGKPQEASKETEPLLNSGPSHGAPNTDDTRP